VSEDVLGLAVSLRERGEAFALATVVRCERPTSAKPGAKALVRADGSVSGWVGGACAEPVVVREALQALRDGQPRLVSLVGEGGASPGRTEGIVPYSMTCHSGGTLEIYVEPFMPKPLLLVIGHGPVVETLAALGRATEFMVDVLPAEASDEAVNRHAFGPSSCVVVATHGAGDEDALERALRAGAGYVSLVASRRRAAAVVRALMERGLGAQHIERLKAPAGLDIGATTPAEIAVSILADIIRQSHVRSSPGGGGIAEAGAGGFEDAAPARPEGPARSEGPARPEGPVRFEGAARSGDAPRSEDEARDPVCGMVVDIRSARHRSEVAGVPVYFCCPACKDAFDREPGQFPTPLRGGGADRH